MPKILAVADAVVTALNGGTWTPTFTALRSYVPEYLPADYATLKVTVVPKDDASEILTRASTQDDIEIDIAVQKKLSNAPVNKFDADPVETDPLLQLLESIKEFFLGNKLAGVNAYCFKAKYVPVFSSTMIREDRIFTGVATLTFRMLP